MLCSHHPFSPLPTKPIELSELVLKAFDDYLTRNKEGCVLVKYKLTERTLNV